MEDYARKFYTEIEARGGTVLGPYVKSHMKVKVLCPEGHSCEIIPSSVMNRDRAFCKICSKHEPETSEKEFISRVGAYVRSCDPVECLCNKKHTCFPTPGTIARGGGLCSKCNKSLVRF